MTALAAAPIAALATPIDAFADAAPPWMPGDIVGVPSAAVKDVFIEHEDLSMDISGVAGSNPQPASVVATYALRNDGPAKSIQLVFYTASANVSAGEITLDGARLSMVEGPSGRVPISWAPPSGTPPLGAGPDIPYQVDRADGMIFHIDLGAGHHTLQTRYRASVSQYSGDASAHEPRYWQLAFVLAPARQWAGFGSLDVTVRIPNRWQSATRPDLIRQGDTLTGHFDGIPSDAVAITTRMPVPYDWTRNGWIAGFGVLVPLCLLVGFMLARRTRWAGFWAGLLAFAPAFAAVFALAVGIAADSRDLQMPAAQQSFNSRLGGLSLYVEAFKALFAGLLVFASASMAGSLAGLASRRKSEG